MFACPNTDTAVMLCDLLNTAGYPATVVTQATSGRDRKAAFPPASPAKPLSSRSTWCPKESISPSGGWSISPRCSRPSGGSNSLAA
jgi:hypothetical protein